MVVVIVTSEEAVTNKIVVENVELKVKLEDVVVLLALEGGGGGTNYRTRGTIADAEKTT